MTAGMRVLTLALVVLSTIGCDRVTKHMATALLANTPAQSYLADSVRLVYAENTGGFLSLGAQLSPAVRTAIFAGGTGFALALLLVALFRSRWPWARSLGMALFIGGELSNWIDRVLRGSVVDFMNVGVGWLRTGIFNVADVAIMAGAVVFLLAEWFARNRDEQA
jgi:signal peptidase II